MHPTVALIIWFFGVLAAQGLGYMGLAVVTLLIFVSTPSSVLSFIQFVRRGRFLLLSLWLIVAYEKTGEALADLPWAPTWEGLAEANMQALRLVVMLACLSWLLARLGRDGMVSALWGALRPLAALGLDVERLVVRLALVLAHLQNPLPAGAWRTILLEDNKLDVSQASIQLSLPPWSLGDRLSLVALAVLLLWMAL